MTYDFIVVGAGIAGASLAYELSAGGSVCLIEAESRPGYHATGRSQRRYSRQPMAAARFVRSLRASRAFFDQPSRGILRTSAAESPRPACISHERTKANDWTAWCKRFALPGGSVSAIDVNEALNRVPLMRAGYVAAAAFDSDAMDIDVHALHQGFIRGARAAGVRLITGTKAVRIKASERPVVDRRERGEPPRTDIGERGGGRGQMNLPKPAARVLWGSSPLGARPCWSMRPRVWMSVVGRWLSIPTRRSISNRTPRNCCSHPPMKYLSVLAMRSQRNGMSPSGSSVWRAALDIEVRRVRHSWAGLRTFAPDRVPVVGYDARVEGLFWCAGQGGVWHSDRDHRHGAQCRCIG